MPINKKPIIRADVAKLAGVSPSTVSLVLNNNPNTRITEKTRKRVFNAAKKIGYHPNATARALVTGRTNNIGIIIFHTGTPFNIYSSAILSGIWTIIKEKGYRLTMDAIKDDDDASKMHRERAADGVIIIAPPPKIVNLEVMTESHLPLVTVGSHPENCEIDYIDIDNTATAYQATSYLLKHGHRDILHISGPLGEVSSADDRLTGYRQAMKEAGLDVKEDLIIRGTYLHKSGCQAIAEARKRGVKFSAIFAANDDSAHGAIDEMQVCGMHVPNDVSVIGIRTQPHIGEALNILTSIQQPLEKIGIIAAEILLGKINGNTTKPKTKFLKGKLVKGLSVINFNTI